MPLPFSTPKKTKSSLDWSVGLDEAFASPKRQRPTQWLGVWASAVTELGWNLVGGGGFEPPTPAV